MVCSQAATKSANFPVFAFWTYASVYNFLISIGIILGVSGGDRLSRMSHVACFSKCIVGLLACIQVHLVALSALLKGLRQVSLGFPLLLLGKLAAAKAWRFSAASSFQAASSNLFTACSSLFFIESNSILSAWKSWFLWINSAKLESLRTTL